jgi:hypothetical protein
MTSEKSKGLKDLCCRNQVGSAVMLMLLGLLIMASAAIVVALSQNTRQQKIEHQTTDSLATARTALLNYLISTIQDPDSELALPCPDLSTATPEGVAASQCGGAGTTALGRLPFRTLGIEPLRDGSSECLWYVVSGSHKLTSLASLKDPLNFGRLRLSDAETGQLLHGDSVEEGLVALIIAPGEPLANQIRTSEPSIHVCGGNYQAAQYLDQVGAINNAAIDASPFALNDFATRSQTLAPSESFNDRVVFISHQELLSLLEAYAPEPDDGDGDGDEGDGDGNGGGNGGGNRPCTPAVCLNFERGVLDQLPGGCTCD